MLQSQSKEWFQFQRGLIITAFLLRNWYMYCVFIHDIIVHWAKEMQDMQYRMKKINAMKVYQKHILPQRTCHYEWQINRSCA